MNHFYRVIIIFSGMLFSIFSLKAQNVTNWGYWLTNIEPTVVQASEYEFLVIDYSRTGIDVFSKEEVRFMKSMPDGGNRTLISYFSLGEAEEYRYYWKDDWKDDKPAWLEKENPDWPGNYKVRYWDVEWQALLFGNKAAYLDKIIDAGFDGIYLDIIDAFEYFESTRPSAERDMVEFVKEIAQYARLKNPEFIIVTQNGERLLAHQDLLDVIDGAAKEDLYYGLEDDHIAVSQSEIDYSLQYLKAAQAQDKFILLASYVPNDKGRNAVKAKADELQFISYFGNRDLDRLFKNHGLQAKPYVKKTEKSASPSQRTPGDFFLNTLYKGQFKSSFGALVYKELSVYEERDGDDIVLFRENVSYNDRSLPIAIEYGVSDNLEVGIRIPLSYTSLGLEETIGGDQTSKTSEVGLGNIALLANLSIPFKEEFNTFSLLSLEYGLPTDTKSQDLKSGSFFALNYTIEKIWNKWGIALGSGVNNFDLSAPLDRTEITYKLGVLGIFTNRIFGDIFYTKRGGRSFVETSAELLITRNSSLELYFAADLQSNVDIKNYGLTYTVFY